METKGSKCRKQLDQLCFRIKDKLEFAENGVSFLLERDNLMRFVIMALILPALF